MLIQGDEEAQETVGHTAEEATALLKQYKSISREVETFEAEFPETCSAELIAILNVCQPVKKFLSFSLLKLIKRAINQFDIDLLKTLI